MPELLIIGILFFVIALIYSSVGFGGGSSYLAILAAFAIPFPELRFYSLVCNIMVVAGSVLYFHRRRLLKWRQTLPIIFLSVPAAFFGGAYRLSSITFFLILATVLLISGLILAYQAVVGYRKSENYRRGKITSALMGLFIGFVSGLSGIGGGIFLSPVLNLSRWDNAKVIAASASLFILVNSASGLAGQLISYSFDLEWNYFIGLPLAVWGGGFIGRRLGILKFNAQQVKLVTALLILFISIRIFIQYL
jgi:hypothetical protein